MKYLVDLFNEVFHWCHQTIEAPTLLTATFIPPNVELAWVDNASNDECWMIWRSTDGTNFTLIDTITAEDLESYSDTTAAAGVLYYYKVQACNLDGDTSDFSNTVQVTNTITPVKFGYLYNWYAVTDVRVMAPVGWHVPTNADYVTLTTFVGGLATSGRELKSDGVTWWTNDNGDDNYSFDLRGNGQRVGGNFNSVLDVGTLWTATSIVGLFARGYSATNASDAMTDPSSGKDEGKGLRWVKDDAVNPGTVADYDGNIYGCVTIGTQVWTDRNAIVTHYNNGDEIPYEDNAGDWAALVTGARCLYNNSYAYL